MVSGSSCLSQAFHKPSLRSEPLLPLSLHSCLAGWVGAPGQLSGNSIGFPSQSPEARRQLPLNAGLCRPPSACTCYMRPPPAVCLPPEKEREAPLPNSFLRGAGARLHINDEEGRVSQWVQLWGPVLPAVKRDHLVSHMPPRGGRKKT